MTDPAQPSLFLSQLLSIGLAQGPENVAALFPDSRWTWRELDNASTRYGSSLLEIGLKPGERAATLMPNSPELLIHYLACFKTGIVAVPLNYRYTPHEIRHALRACGASALLASSDRDADIAASVEDGARRLGVISSRGNDRHCHSFELLAKKGAEEASFAVPGCGNPAVIFFTSGSTGPAKGVTHSYESLGWVISNYIGATRMGPRDAVLLTGSMSHIGSFLDCFCPLAVGGRAVVPRRFDAESLLRMIRLHNPSVLCALPVALFDLVRHGGACAADFASVRLCGSGGDKVSGELHREVASRVGLAINEQYGMTETGISAMHSTDGPPLAGPLGKAIPGYKFSVRDEGGAELPTGQQGRLWVKSRANMIGYWAISGRPTQFSGTAGSIPAMW